jgi:F-type H+-transporting ATPase subunit a
MAPVLFRAGPVQFTSTVIYTWIDMAFLVAAAAILTRTVTLRMTPGQNVLELIVEQIMDNIEAVTATDPRPLLALVGTLALFLAVGNTMSIIPGLEAPTRDLSATAALAVVVFFAVPYYGIRSRGLEGFLRHYLEPSWVLLPFNLASEVSRTVAMAVRLFGNIVRGAGPGRLDPRGGPLRAHPHHGPGAAHRPRPGLHLRRPHSGLHRRRAAPPRT